MLFPAALDHHNNLDTTDEPTQKWKAALRAECNVSNLAMEGDNPRHNKNYRNNPSLVIALRNGQHHILIDAGKTFREGALRWFPTRGITSLDGIILTHHHMDAAGGLDDVRGFQKWQHHHHHDHAHSLGRRAVPMPIFLAQDCLDELGERFPWLLGTKKGGTQPGSGYGTPSVNRHVATFDVHVITPFHEFEVVEGLKVIPLPVMHGEDLISLGFAFRVGSQNIVYLSDISRMPPQTLEYIQNKLPRTDVLIVDALKYQSLHPVHYSMEQAIELAKVLRPKQCYLIGMDCDDFPPHDAMNAELKQKYGNIQLAHDGLVLDMS